MINKKKLIELFEDRLPHSTYEEEYVLGNYFPCIAFTSNLVDIIKKNPSDYVADDYGMFKTSYGDCRMAIIQKYDMYFITFNSIEIPISFPEFKKLKKLFSFFKEEQLKYNNAIKNIQDKKLLDKVFCVKSKKETRNILTEKINDNMLPGKCQTKTYEY